MLFAYTDEWSIDWLIAWDFCEPFDFWMYWLIDWLIDRSLDVLIDWLIDWLLFVFQVGCLALIIPTAKKLYEVAGKSAHPHSTLHSKHKAPCLVSLWGTSVHYFSSRSRWTHCRTWISFRPLLESRLGIARWKRNTTHAGMAPASLICLLSANLKSRQGCVDCSRDGSINWLVDWSIDWLIDWSIDRLIDCLIDWLIDRLFGWSIDWLIDWLIDWWVRYIHSYILLCWLWQGEKAVDFLQNLCSNDVDVPIGGVVHTGMHNEQGGYENDCTVARLDHHSCVSLSQRWQFQGNFFVRKSKGSQFSCRFLVVAPTIQQTRCKKWLIRHLPPQGGITVDDVTSSYTVINVIGPLARDLMNNFSDMSQAAFPFFTCQVCPLFEGLLHSHFTGILSIKNKKFSMVFPSSHSSLPDYQHWICQQHFGHEYYVCTQSRHTLRRKRNGNPQHWIFKKKLGGGGSFFHRIIFLYFSKNFQWTKNPRAYSRHVLSDFSSWHFLLIVLVWGDLKNRTLPFFVIEFFLDFFCFWNFS